MALDATAISDDEWVELEPVSEPTKSEPTTNKPDLTNDDMCYEAYDAFVSDTSTPSPVFEANGVCYVLRHGTGGRTLSTYSKGILAEAREVARSHAKCNTCISRSAYICDQGPAGPVFLHNLTAAAAPCKQIIKLRQLAARTCSQSAKPEIVMVTATTYAPVMDREGSFMHWTVTPTRVTAPDVAQKFEKLSRYVGSMDTRLAKLTEPEALQSVAIMAEEQHGLDRPDHYAACLRWVQGVQRMAAEQCSSGGGSFEKMSHADQYRLRVLAIMSGRVEGTAHLDFHQADNIVDFCLLPSRDALRAEMDRRSHPQFYMVSQLNRKLASAGVVSKWIIGLTWNGEFADDLDLHVITPSGTQIFYGNKRGDGCTLDFDANVNTGEAQPCENISVRPGTYRVKVNNFTRRTFGRPVPFQIVCRQEGTADVVYDGAWGVNQQKGQMTEVCTHTFTEVGVATPTMSANAASRAKALDGEWATRVGEPSATIATVESMRGKPGLEMVVCGNGAKGKGGSAAACGAPEHVGRAFMEMAVSPRANSAAAEGGSTRKRYLSESCRKQPATVKELIAHLKANPSAILAVQLRDHAPGYLVDIACKNEGVRKSSLPASCHFKDKFTYPGKPVVGSTAAVGNARLDATWLLRGPSGQVGGGGRVTVSAVAEMSGVTFLALKGASLPRAAGAGAGAFPLSSGFYPTDLAAEYHAHRERWAYYHTQLKPSMPQPGKACVPMVGCFLTADSAVVYLDGVKLTLKTGS